MDMALSTVTTQPLPFGRLEREKHIEMLFRAFHRGWGASTEIQDAPASFAHTHGILSGQQLAAEAQAPGPGLEDGGEEGRGRSSRTTAGMELESLGCGERWASAGFPEGLAALDTVSQIHITARPELQGPRCVPRRTYSIASETRDQLFVAVEESSCVCVQCCGPARSCTLQGFSRQAQHLFLFQRPLRADMCCLGCCLMEMRAYTANRELIGTVYQRWSMFTPYFEVCDSEGVSLVRIQGSCCPVRCVSSQEFQVVSIIGETIGTIWKKWPGYNEDCNMDHEYFGFDVPQTMSVKTKVLLLAATFLINHMFFEMS